MNARRSAPQYLDTRWASLSCSDLPCVINISFSFTNMLKKKPMAASACLRRGTSAKSRRHSLRAPVCGRGRPPRRSKRAEGAGTLRSAAERARRAAQPRPQQAWAGWEGGVRKRGVSGGRKREGKTLRRGSGAAQTAAAA